MPSYLNPKTNKYEFSPASQIPSSGNEPRLPSKNTWENRYPNRAMALEQAQAFGESAFPGIASAVHGVRGMMNPPVEYGMSPDGQPLSQQQGPGLTSSSFAKSPSAEIPVSDPSEPVPPMPDRRPKSYQEMHNLGRAGALQNSIGESIGQINQDLGVGEMASTLLHNFADSSVGRKVTDVLIRGNSNKDIANKAIEGYRKFVSSWMEKPDKSKSKTVKISDPVPVKAAMLNSEDKIAKVIAAVDKKPAIITDAEDLGFSANKVLIVQGDTPVDDPDAILSSARTPVVTQRGFMDVMKYMGQ